MKWGRISPKGVWESNCTYTGSFVDDLMDGHGLLDGEACPWGDQEMHKYGFVTIRHDGKFAAGLADGPGTRRFANGSLYDGDFAQGFTAGDGWWKLKDMERVVKQGKAWPFDEKRQYWWWSEDCKVIFDGPA